MPWIRKGGIAMPRFIGSSADVGSEIARRMVSGHYPRQVFSFPGSVGEVAFSFEEPIFPVQAENATKHQLGATGWISVIRFRLRHPEVPVRGCLWADSAWVVHLSLTPDIEVTVRMGDGDPHAGEEGVEKTYYGWHAVTTTI